MRGAHAPDGTPITLAASADDPQGLKIALGVKKDEYPMMREKISLDRADTSGQIF